MTSNNPPTAGASTSEPTNPQVPRLLAPILIGLLSWVAISVGFFGLKMLMYERPEFIGQPMRVTRVKLVQESPQIVARKVTDDISVIKPLQPEFSDVRFEMRGRRDYRGLKTIMDMSGEFHAQYVLTNAFDEPLFVLFKCPHPQTDNGTGGSLPAGALKLQASTPGTQENARDAWYWSGTLEARSASTVEISYHVASLKGVAYRVGAQNGNPVKQHRVSFQRQDLGTMHFESGDGAIRSPGAVVTWERTEFLAPDFFAAEIVEGRSLFASLAHLLEIGPLICLLFLLAVSAVILVRQPVTAVQMLTIAAGYALYFPLLLYLSSRFVFPVALAIAFLVPGILLVNYSRWLLGPRLGLMGCPLFLVLYQVFPTLAAFAGWNRGMVLLCLGVVTLAVLINLQNQALKRKTAAVAALIGLLLVPCKGNAADVQIVLPGEIANNLLRSNRESTNSLVAFGTAQYQVRQEGTFFSVQAQIPFEVLRPGETPVPLFDVPVYLQNSEVESKPDAVARLVTVTNRIGLFVQRTGAGTLRFWYRVPIENREGRKHVQIPVALGSSGNVRLESPRNDFEILSGSLWIKSIADEMTSYDIGVPGEGSLVIEWRDQPGAAPAAPTEGSKEFYGIGITRAQNLTVVNSDGSCTHFAEFDLPVFQTEEFRMKLPAGARLISVSVNGTEVGSPTVEEQMCRIRLPGREAQQTVHRLSFRIACPPVRLGFVGMAELSLPEVFQTAGTLDWVVALPNGFEPQVISSGLEKQKSPPDLSRFGDYGRILRSHPHTHLAKDLAPPGLISLSLKYRQHVPGMYEPDAE